MKNLRVSAAANISHAVQDPNMNVRSLLLFIPLFLVLPGCTTSMVVDDWEGLPRNTPIEIHTVDGKECSLDNWRITTDSNIVGIGKTDSSTWRTFVIPRNSVVSVSANKQGSAETLEKTVIVVGSVAGIAAVLWVIDILEHIPSVHAAIF